MKPIRFSKHAESYIEERGFTKEEVEKVIREEVWIPAKKQKQESKLNFLFENYWQGKFYKLKQVRPIFVEEEFEIVVITVYVYYIKE